MAETQLRPHCLICQRRISTKEKSYLAGYEHLWENVKEIGDRHGISYQDSDKTAKICYKCHPKIAIKRPGFYKLIPKRKKRKLANVHSTGPNNIQDIEPQIEEEDIGATTNESIDSNQLMASNRPISTHLQSKLWLETSDFSNTSQNSSLVDSQATTLSFDSQASLGYSSVSDPSIQTQFTDCENRASSSTSSSSLMESSRFAIPNTTVFVKIRSYPSSQNKCFICQSKNGRNAVPKSAIVDTWLKKKILIPLKNRICSEHLDSKHIFKDDALKNIECTEFIRMSGDDVKSLLLTFMSNSSTTSCKSVSFDENSHYLSEDYEQLTGISRCNFDDMYSHVKQNLRDSNYRSKRSALGLFLMKVRHNNSQAALAVLFGLQSQQSVSQTFKTALGALLKHFVPKHLGYQHLTREGAKLHQSAYVNKIFGLEEDSIAIIADGTYLFINQPEDINEQKKTYCVYKHGNLLKPMMLVFPNGYILAVEGLYYSDGGNNDAKILECMINAQTGLGPFLQQKDLFILDRGFRDVIEKLEERGFKTCMPQLLDKNQEQFTTREANETRKVTSCRWPVEVRNGHIKIFKIMNGKIDNGLIPQLDPILQVICAIINAFFKLLYKDSEEQIKKADSVLERMSTENLLAKMIEELGIEKKTTTVWRKATQLDIPEFPKLTVEDLKLITLGPFQLRKAVLYTRRHLEMDSSYGIWIHKEKEGLVRSRIGSRMMSNKSHQLWVLFDNQLKGDKAIKSYYCKCKTGARTVGCCSHVASVLWYMGFARHEDKDLTSLKRKISDYVLDAASLLQRQLGGEHENSESEDSSDNE